MHADHSQLTSRLNCREKISFLMLSKGTCTTWSHGNRVLPIATSISLGSTNPNVLLPPNATSIAPIIAISCDIRWANHFRFAIDGFNFVLHLLILITLAITRWKIWALIVFSKEQPNDEISSKSARERGFSSKRVPRSHVFLRSSTPCGRQSIFARWDRSKTTSKASEGKERGRSLFALRDDLRFLKKN